MNRWRDTAVYVDGRPVGVLDFGELPIGLHPVWVKEKHSVEIEPGSKGPTFKWVEARRYRFTDYLKALGVDLRQVKELQMMGPKATEITVVSGAELRSKKAEGFQFRFGSLVGGKPIPVLPPNFGNRIQPDKIGAVMVYVHRKPPVVKGDEGMFLDGKPVDDVPYFGEPMRGGVRIYFDDRLALQLEPPLLQSLPSTPSPDGQRRYSLWALLQSQGIDTTKIVEGWAIADERRKARFSAEALQKMSFEVPRQGHNQLLLGEAQVPASALALHSRALTNRDLPQIRPDEE